MHARVRETVLEMRRSNPAWNRAAILLLITAAAYSRSWAELWPLWERKNDTYTHGTLVALIALWLVWRARRFVVGLTPRMSLHALPALFLASALWLLAANANLFLVHIAWWPILAFVILWAGCGWQVASKFVFPLGFLYFAIPVWEYLKPPLQVLAATAVGLLTKLAGITAAVDGPYVVLPGATIYIALGCSGVHFLSVAIAVGVLAGIFRNDSIPTRCLIVLIAGALAIVFNWLRILIIIFGYLHPELRAYLENIDHLTLGWWVFAFDLVVFYLALRWVPASELRSSAETEAAPPPRARRDTAGFVITFVAAVALPVAAGIAPRLQEYPPPSTAVMPLPEGATRISPDYRWRPRFRGFVSEHRLAYLDTSGRVIEVYRNEYHRQAQDAELISKGTYVFDPERFEEQEAEVSFLFDGDGVAIRAKYVELLDLDGQRWAAVYTYFVDGKAIADRRLVQLTTAFRSFFGLPVAGVLAVATNCDADCASARSSLERAFLAAHDAYRSTRRSENDLS